MTNAQKTEMYNQIERHGKALMLAFPNATEKNPVKLCKKLRRLENKAHALAMEYCNGSERTPEQYEEEETRIMYALHQLLPPNGMRVFLNYDARGYALKIDDKDTMEYNNRDEINTYTHIFTDWGGYGIIAPDFTPAD